MNHFREILGLRIPITWVVGIFCAQLGVAGTLLVAYGIDLDTAGSMASVPTHTDIGHVAFMVADR